MVVRFRVRVVECSASVRVCIAELLGSDVAIA